MEWHCIMPEKPQRNAFEERYRVSLRDVWLNEPLFGSLSDARRLIEAYGRTASGSDRMAASAAGR